MKTTFRFVTLTLAIWLASYLGYRSFNQQVWAADGKVYVLLPDGPGVALYYLWRPLMLADGALTGMNFHIGPHRQ